ncbi:adenylate/guanylate cyclase domain-containing protein [Xylophilus sp. GOD-11R]|uniref:CHASE2 domain-containing protein n=1 Tax=Xylophilus sp. GOD-11R TaxID=3089814 RepID=UPI00298BEB70|nr:adenylate/guanylate cyclase domain-containing protein [Xylophilus sp. GOD-11R]WPB56871.1 adenylate/guanylate cyclase domain-containing protein [Xylophilus sp. GOD-11R]
MGWLAGRKRRIAWALAPVAFALFCEVSGTGLRVLERIDHFIYDLRLRSTMPRTLDERVVIVDIDERSLGQFGHWPWGRDKLARLTQELFDRQQAAVVGFDVLFGEADDSSGLVNLQRLAEGPLRDTPGFAASVRRLGPSLDYDRLFADALQGRRAVLGYYFSNDSDDGLRGVLPAPALASNQPDEAESLPRLATQRWNSAGASIPLLAQAAPRAGFMNSLPDRDGVIRSVSLVAEFGGHYYESLALGMYRALLGDPRLLPVMVPGQPVSSELHLLEGLLLDRGDNPQLVPVDERASTLVAFRGRGGPAGGSFRYIPAADLLDGKLPAGSLAGKLVLVGTTAPGLLDLRTTPVGSAYPGVETHANILSNLLDGQSLVRPDYEPGYTALTTLAAGMLLAFSLPLLSLAWGVLTTAIVAAALIGANVWFFAGQGLVLPIALPLLTVLAVFAADVVAGYFIETRSKRQLARLFGTYVPGELVTEMLREPGRYSMQAENRDLTVMFCDMRGFTAMSETMEPLALQALLNRVFSRLTEVIRHQRGTIDKYMGDCVMAFWGAPVAAPDHARLAVRAGIDMAEAIRTLNQEHAELGLPAIGVGIGINTGVMCVGDMGSDLRRSYTVIGDAVNLGSRLEGLSRLYGVDVVVSESTREQAGDDFGWLELDLVTVKGRQRPVRVFTPVDAAGGTPPPDIASWNALLAGWRTQDWESVRRGLDSADYLWPHFATLHSLYAARLADAIAHPPDPAWDGSTRLDTK